MSKRLVPGACGVACVAVCGADAASCAAELEPSPRCETASGAMAAPFTKPRLVMFVMVVSSYLGACNSGFLYDFRNAGSKIHEHHRRSITPWAASDRTTRISCCARLIKARYGHAVLRPTGHRAHGTALRCAGAAGVATAVPVVRIHAFQIEWTFGGAREHFVVR